MSADTTSLPLGPLIAIAKVMADVPTDGGGGGFSDQHFADMIGLSTRAISRWRKNGGRVPWATADEAATKLGLHPLLVWGDEWAAMDEDLVNGRDRKAAFQVEKALRQIGAVLAKEKDERLESAGASVRG